MDAQWPADDALASEYILTATQSDLRTHSADFPRHVGDKLVERILGAPLPKSAAGTDSENIRASNHTWTQTQPMRNLEVEEKNNPRDCPGYHTQNGSGKIARKLRRSFGRESSGR